MTTATRTLVRVIAAAVVAGVLAGPAGTAFGAALTLDLRGPTTLTVGRTTILQATGTVPVSAIQLSYFLSLDAIPASVMTTCPADRWAAVQVAGNSGGSVVVVSQSEHPDDPTGAFAIPIALTPSAPGKVLLCAYSDDGETRTLASASMLVTIRPATRDATRAITDEARGAIRSCRALLPPSPSRACVRRALRHAEGRCRARGTRRARAACLRSIHRLRSTTGS